MGGFNGGDGRTNFVRHSISAAHNRLWQGDRRYIYDDGVNSTSPGRNQTSTIAYTSIIPTGEKSFAVVYNMDRGGHWSGGSSAAPWAWLGMFRWNGGGAGVTPRSPLFFLPRVVPVCRQ